MSGGFFRGTSADQDTRFSNKQAKLLKTQKFPPELEHLVDMTKVKMDVMKPWIANRVTELIGFEDEVLINFIYTLLDGKVVNGKEVQISLTGFMERNTGKFMKELWSLLLSAQQNASGVPQQFLDAKEEETRKKKAETDRIANEIQRKKEKEKREREEEANKKMDGDVDNGMDTNSSLEQSKHQSRPSGRRSGDDKQLYDRSGSRGRSSGPRSPGSADCSSSPRRKGSRSLSKSFSNSRSYSNERLRSKSVSRSPQSRGSSVSSERKEHSRLRRSISPRWRRSPRRYSSPSRHRYSRRRSISPLRYRSPSLAQRRMRSPPRRRLRSPLRHRSRSPQQHRSSSPSSRSRSPVRRRFSSVRRWSRTPVRRRSPVPFRRRSPSPFRRRSPSLSIHRYRRSMSTPRRRSKSPIRRRSPRKRSVSPVRHISHSPQDLSSPSSALRNSPSSGMRRSPVGKRRLPARSPVERVRSREKYSPTHYSSTSEDAEHPIRIRKRSDSSKHQSRSPQPLMSLQKDSLNRIGSHKEVLPAPSSPNRSPSISESPPVPRRRNPSEERSGGSYELSLSLKKDKNPESLSPLPKRKQEKVCRDKSDSSRDGDETNSRRDVHERKYRSHRELPQALDNLKDSSNKVHRVNEPSPKGLVNHRSSELHNDSASMEPKKIDEVLKSAWPVKPDCSKGSDHRELSGTHKGTSSSRREMGLCGEEGRRVVKHSQSPSIDIKNWQQGPENMPELARKGKQHDHSSLMDSGSDDSDQKRTKFKNKEGHKRAKREEIASDDDSSSDSYIEDRKEAKRRRKEGKKLKKEERRRRREERRRRKEERRAEKRRRKLTDGTTPPSDFGRMHSSDDEFIKKRERHASGREETEADPKELEIALREKALESLRAKKGIGR